MCEEKSQSQTNTLNNQTNTYQQPSVENSQADESTFHEPVTSLKGEWVKVCLEPIVTLAQLSDLHEQLRQCIGARVQLNGAKVERIDTAALQLLLAFWNNPDVTVGWVEASAELCSAARLLNLSSHLGLPAQEASLPLGA